MSPANTSTSLANLKALTYRISNTPTQHLPLLVTQISGSLWNSKDLLSAPPAGSKNEISTLLHRFHQKIGTLLQDRTIEGRWSGVVLCKAVIETGGVEVLSRSSAWTRHLIAILKKNDPPTTRCLAIVTLTRIFMLTWGDSNLVREVTTPVLPSFVAATLSNAEKARCSARELLFVLEAYVALLPKHPTIFRAKEAQIRGLAIVVLSRGSGRQQRDVAQRLLALLHYCAPKQGGSEAWDASFQAAIGAAHTTCARLFRSVVEDWTSSAGVTKPTDASIYLATEARLDVADRVGFSGWQGVLAGRERLITLLGLVKAHLQSTTVATVSVRLGLLFDLLTRVLSLTVRHGADTNKTNPQVSKEEREALFPLLPAMHVEALELVSTLLDRFKQASIPFVQTLLELVTQIYRAEHFDEQIRAASYACLQRILQLCGPSLSKETVQDFTSLIRGCCNDILPSTVPNSHTNGTSTINHASKPAKPAVPLHSSAATTSAIPLLPTLITHLNPAYTARKLRTQIERTAVLTRNEEALLACVMNPARKDVGGSLQTSLLPLLAREFPDASAVEALLRPRMPPAVVRGSGGGDEAPEDGDEEKVDDDDEEVDVLPDIGTNGAATVDDGSGVLQDMVVEGDEANRPIDEDDLYNATPPPASTSALKRPATTDAQPSAAMKRLRAYLAEDTGSAGVQPEVSPHPTIPSNNPVTVAADTNAGGAQISTIIPAQQAVDLDAGGAAAAGERAVEDMASDDGSDFEIPPLTMEASDDEDEEEG